MDVDSQLGGILNNSWSREKFSACIKTINFFNDALDVARAVNI